MNWPPASVAAPGWRDTTWPILADSLEDADGIGQLNNVPHGGGRRLRDRSRRHGVLAGDHSSRTTSELAFAWDLTAPEVSRHLAVLRRAGLLTTERRGRYVHYSVDLTALTALGADLLAAMLR
jgi:DNA-binding transcriptional ArsR family regulator